MHAFHTDCVLCLTFLLSLEIPLVLVFFVGGSSSVCTSNHHACVYSLLTLTSVLYSAQDFFEVFRIMCNPALFVRLALTSDSMSLVRFFVIYIQNLFPIKTVFSFPAVITTVQRYLSYLWWSTCSCTRYVTRLGNKIEVDVQSITYGVKP